LRRMWDEWFKGRRNKKAGPWPAEKSMAEG